ncbi:hypothetical protein O159_26250 [Leifsonia xyli subsp. cynodontis DSM 46306]|uniref:Uncharacterized protein n=1 Tax=Leifsonia xyli subsp. cynodontis DSM 46306 TaxID=1389489 RepID=U3P9M6_LEIXC|nr:hypothetical protein [Leifsonia xyli]AGW41294.1 hypothetical protein O159_12110 [Leifsonia xyli subsp. cynodontis DSM 46306]AGW42536.1 hypothetical protein O159_26250 [Leifsonia xyli subsp. cynodontis DSM 46306]
MTARSGLFVAPTSSGAGTAPIDARLALSGIIGATPQLVQGGTVSQSASTMAFTIAPAVLQLPDPTNAAASFVSAIDQTVLTPAAGPATGSRIDLIVAKQNNPENGDADARASFSLIAGTAGAPGVAPAVPAGYLRYADITVPTNAASAAACTLTLRSPTTFAPVDIIAATYALLSTVTGTAGQHATIYNDNANNGDYVWSGGGWVSAAVAQQQGLTLITPTSVAATGGTASVSARGAVTYSGVTKLVISGVFTSVFTNYKVIIANTGKSAASNTALQMVAGGAADATAANYQAVRGYDTGTGRVVNTTAGTLGAIELEAGTQTLTDIEVTLYGPALAANVTIAASAVSYPYSAQISGKYLTAASHDGFALSQNTSGTMTGQLWIYGLGKG